MVVAVQKGLENLAEQLRQTEFEVVMLGDYNHPVDAIVYGTGDRPSGMMSSNISVSSSSHGHFGVFMVNAQNKSVGEVAEILRRRTYTPLF